MIKTDSLNLLDASERAMLDLLRNEYRIDYNDKNWKKYTERLFWEKINNGNTRIGNDDFGSRVRVNTQSAKRRLNALITNLPRYRERFKDRVEPALPAPESLLIDICTVPEMDFDDLDDRSFITAAAALWMLDRIYGDNGKDEDIVHLPQYPIGTDFYALPNVQDSMIPETILLKMLALILQRNEEKPSQEVSAVYLSKNILRRAARPHEYSSSTKSYNERNPRDWFDHLLSRLPEEDIKGAVSRFEAKEMELYSLFIDYLLPLFREIHTDSCKLIEQIELLSRIRNEEKKPSKPSLPSRAVVSKDKVLRSFEAPSIDPLFSSKAPFLNDRAEKSRVAHRILLLHETKQKKQIEADRAISMLLFGVLFDIGFDPSEVVDNSERLEHIRKFQVEDPYEMCFAFLYLLDSGSDLAWLRSLAYLVVSAAARQLPWAGFATSRYDEDFEDALAKAPAPELGGKVDYRRWKPTDGGTDSKIVNPLSAVQILCRSSGRIPLRQRAGEETIRTFTAQGMDLAEAEKNAELSNLLRATTIRFAREWAEVDYDADDWEDDFLDEDPDDEPYNDFDPTGTDETEQLRSEVERLRSKVEECKRVITEAQREKASLRDELGSLKKTLESATRERDALQIFIDKLEAVDSSGEEENDAPVQELPYVSSGRYIVFGGHETWTKAIREMLLNVRFVYRHALVDESALIGADTVWIQPNALPHAMFYRIIKTVRKYGLDLQYFSYASAEKCARQLAAYDRLRTASKED